MHLIDEGQRRIMRHVVARPWLEHVVRAAQRYQTRRGNHFAAGITYFTVLSLFPLLMVAFAAAGFVLAGNATLLHHLQNSVVQAVPGELGGQLNQLIDQAVRSRATVGLLGLLTGLYSGLAWISNLRAALTEQWEQQTSEEGWLRDKASDLVALLSLGLALVVSLGLSVVASSDLGRQVLTWVKLSGMPGARTLLTVVSTILALLASWAVFAWMIARLPREPVTVASAARAAAIAAVGFEVFKLVASIYMQSIMSSPAGAAFGSVIGVMVFINVVYRIVLFATAWAATAAENAPPVPVPEPVVIKPRVAGSAVPARDVLAVFSAGALAGVGLLGLRRRSRRSV